MLLIEEGVYMKETRLETLVIRVTPDTIAGLGPGLPWHGISWKIAGLYLASLIPSAKH